MSETATNPPRQPDAQALLSRTVGTLEAAFGKQRMLEGLGSRGLDAPGALLDEVGVELRATLDSKFPGRSNDLRMSADAVTRPDGSTEHRLHVKMGDGTSVDLSIDDRYRMRADATQALPGATAGSPDRTVPLPSVELRYDRGSQPDLAMLQRNLGSEAAPRWGPATLSAALPGLSTVTNNAADGASSVLQNSAATPVGRLLERDESGGIRAQRGGKDVTLPESYRQDGQILFNGSHVVMQGTRGTSDPVVYDKVDLLSRAAHPDHLDRLLDRGGMQQIVVRDGRTDAVPAQAAGLQQSPHLQNPQAVQR